MKHKNLFELKQKFVQNWSIEKLRSMKIEEYTNLDKTSFCYWVESITTNLGSISGGSAYKFGIFKRANTTSTNYNEKRKSDGVYAWYGKYGDNKEEVFQNVKAIVIDIAENAINHNLKAIDEIDLGTAYKWKIAFLYSDFKIMNIFKYEALLNSAEYLGYSGKDKRYSALNDYIIEQKGEKDFFEFSRELWSEYSSPSESE